MQRHLSAVVYAEGAVTFADLAGDREQQGVTVLQTVVKAGLEEYVAQWDAQ